MCKNSYKKGVVVFTAFYRLNAYDVSVSRSGRLRKSRQKEEVLCQQLSKQMTLKTVFRGS
jgi:hypothetical protein